MMFYIALQRIYVNFVLTSLYFLWRVENKLAKLTKNRIKQKEPTSRDIINSLAVFHEDQMRRYIDDTVGYCPSSNAVGMEESSLQASYLHRKIYPERQPLYPEEVTELLKEDLMAERFEELNVVDNTAHSGSEQKDNISGQLCAKSGAVHSGGTGEKSDLVNDSAPCEQSSETVPQDNDSNSPSASENWANFDHMNVVNERDS